MSIIRNDKVILMKPFGTLQTVGETYEVANITDTAIVLRDAKTKIAVCAVNINDIDEYFKKPENANGWTSWQRLVDQASNTIAFYRTNFKKVQVKTSDGIRGEATCNKGDEFNLYVGIHIAWKRAENKILEQVRKDYEEGLTRVNADILNNKNYMKRLINSLCKETD